jgi:hypothetical protein
MHKSFMIVLTLVSLAYVSSARADLCFRYQTTGGGTLVARGAKLPAVNTCAHRWRCSRMEALGAPQPARSASISVILLLSSTTRTTLALAPATTSSRRPVAYRYRMAISQRSPAVAAERWQPGPVSLKLTTRYFSTATESRCLVGAEDSA